MMHVALSGVLTESRRRRAARRQCIQALIAARVDEASVGTTLTGISLSRSKSRASARIGHHS